MATKSVPDYSEVVSATGFLSQRASRSLSTFHDHLITAHRILALFGAGLSAFSGIGTYRGPGGHWCAHDAAQLSTSAAFSENPALAEPNAAHVALLKEEKLKQKKRDKDEGEEFLALTMNVDDLSQRAGHRVDKLWH
ncbi:DHS-like NAD/FAD-binding domain-containing protein [Massarina eburnea CBS 473.64]|uniref:DHS-like NAD/FAD-binding domain-containing protein n=1 Tax=Massarina eburnea CBS 473.64 TaxID=1395130 RepID=A0A6A6RJD9_9PLEO|nr:DHS-like NAD/FAD-binding domain-containing protein [Massarina eburnea CBS 473.64]